MTKNLIARYHKHVEVGGDMFIVTSLSFNIIQLSPIVEDRKK